MASSSKSDSATYTVTVDPDEIVFCIRSVKSYVDDLHNLLNRSSLTERKAFIRSFVKEVKVTGDEVLLNYTMPLPPEGISEEKVGVLSTVHYGGQ